MTPEIARDVETNEKISICCIYWPGLTGSHILRDTSSECSHCSREEEGESPTAHLHFLINANTCTAKTYLLTTT